MVEFLTAEKLKPYHSLVCSREKRSIREKEAGSKVLIILPSPSPAYTQPASSHLTCGSSDLCERTLRLLGVYILSVL